MPHHNNAYLVQQLQSLTLLDNRYSGLQLVNGIDANKRGFFSIVFKAFDEVDQRYVALKFFDQDPAKQIPYRLECFDREHEILSTLLRISRCLQVASPIQQFPLSLNNIPAPFTLNVKYFATEWIEGDLDQYFLSPQSQPTIDKLMVFNDAVLAVESLHAREIFHRDLKADNFRVRTDGDAKETVAIDLGTAARSLTKAMLPNYGAPVGHQRYAPPECFTDLSGVRRIIGLTDVYALGCMLFELFAAEDFFTAYRTKNPDIDYRIRVLQSRVATGNNEAERLSIWQRDGRAVLAGLSHPEIEGFGATVPMSVVDILDDLIAKMTKPNYLDRSIRLPAVRSRIWSAIRCLQNQELARKRADIAAKRRVAKKEHAIAKAHRLAARLRLGGSTSGAI